ncbi:MAG: sulfite exporter TauE/SafE family protein [Isosphaeraceae bacterium]
MKELMLVLLGGVLGSSHCIGMCGGFALTIGVGAPSVVRNFTRQLLYSLGRVFTYAFLGAAAGFAGLWFSRRSIHLIHAQSLLSLLAGGLLILQGLITLGLIPLPTTRFWTPSASSSAGCMAGSLVRPFFASPRWHLVFLAGVLNGFLPCGLVYGYLALATSTASLPYGVATMAAFGLGTIPAMVLTGVGVSAVTLSARRHLFRVAGVCVLITGVLAVSRGAAAWTSDNPAQCPGCRTSASHKV